MFVYFIVILKTKFLIFFFVFFIKQFTLLLCNCLIKLFVFLLIVIDFIQATSYSSKQCIDHVNKRKHMPLKRKNLGDVCCEQFVQISIITLTVVIASW